MSSLFEGIRYTATVAEIYDRIQLNYPGSPHSRSGSLWLLRRASEIRSDNRSAEKMLEKAVAMLAERGHMAGWYNQCPVASGIVSSSSDRNSAVDLVHCSNSKREARFIELKWDSDNPLSALQQILQYGIAYIFCRVHRRELPLHYRSLMDAQQVTLEVVAPRGYYGGSYQNQFSPSIEAWLNQFESEEESDSATPDRVPSEISEFLSETNHALRGLARAKTGGALEMSLDALSFPVSFDEVPFQNGQEVRQKCSTKMLTDEGRLVRDAFSNLRSVWPDS